MELHAIGSALFHALRPGSGRVVVLADWTNRHDFVQLALALPFQGRALPFYSVVVEKGDGSGAHEGLMIEAEARALEALSAMCGDAITPSLLPIGALATGAGLKVFKTGDGTSCSV